jgi:hypothetical protein
MTSDSPNTADIVERLLQRIAYALSVGRVRECINSIRGGEDDWQFQPKEAHRTKPYPMGFYDDDSNLYWAISWGMSTLMFPWERWLLRRELKARSTLAKVTKP